VASPHFWSQQSRSRGASWRPLLAILRAVNALRRLFGYNPARELALRGVEKRRADKLAVARQMRVELGLPPSQALEG
jgi:hypothetical protein